MTAHPRCGFAPNRWTRPCGRRARWHVLLDPRVETDASSAFACEKHTRQALEDSLDVHDAEAVCATAGARWVVIGEASFCLADTPGAEVVERELAGVA